MGLLTFSINVTLGGCVDHREGIADDETHAFFTRMMDESGAMLWGRVTDEMMESFWPAVARGDEEAPPAIREVAADGARRGPPVHCAARRCTRAFNGQDRRSNAATRSSTSRWCGSSADRIRSVTMKRPTKLTHRRALCRHGYWRMLLSTVRAKSGS